VTLQLVVARVIKDLLYRENHEPKPLDPGLRRDDEVEVVVGGFRSSNRTIVTPPPYEAAIASVYRDLRPGQTHGFNLSSDLVS
jgi:hypothetical protein